MKNRRAVGLRAFSRFATIAILLLSCILACSDGGVEPGYPRQILFEGIGENGIYDPSLARDPGSERIWMSYSAVDYSKWPKASEGMYNQLIRTRIAYSDDKGGSWTDAGIIVNESVDSDAEGSEDTWVNEVSNLVYDPDDIDANKRWKLFWHHYLWRDGAQLFQYGWIGMKTAPSPLGPWSAERKRFAGLCYDSKYGATEEKLSDIPALSACQAFTEPGLLARGGALYLSMLGSEGSSTSERVILLKSVDSGDNWSYLGTLLDYTNDPKLNPGVYHGYSAPEIFEKDGQIYLMVTPQVNDAYIGTLVFKIANLETAELVRKDGLPVVVEEVYGSMGPCTGQDGYRLNGSADYIPESRGSGIIYGEVYLDETPRFRIYGSGINL